MKKIGRTAALGVAMAAAAALSLQASPTLAAAKHVMKLAIVVANDPLHEFIRAYKAKVEELSGGRVSAELYPSAQLGKIPRLIEGLQLGTIEFFGTPAGFLKGVDPRFQVLEVPGIFDSPGHAHDTITDARFREPFLDMASAKGIKGVSIWMYGPTSYASLTPMRTLSDFKGQKFRVLATKVETEVMGRLGATGVPMPYTETLPALQRKLIDGIRSNIVVMAATKHFTVTKFITVVNDTYIPSVGFVSMVFYNKLPRDLQKVVEDAGRAVEPHMFQVGREFAKTAEQKWRDGGAEVIRLSDADQKKFMEVTRPIGDDVLGSRDDTREMFTLMKTVAKSHAGM